MNIYYDADHPASYGGVKRLALATGASKLQTVEWLKAQRPYTLHKPVRKRYSTRPYKTVGIDVQWQADLVEMIPYANVNGGYRYILTLIDLFSRYAWAEALRNKTATEVEAAFRRVFAQGRRPQRLQTDDGREFDNRIVQHLLNIENILFFTVKSQFKAAVVERFNRTLKTKMWRYFTRTGSYRWIDVLPDLLTSM
jgi:IS30 family transposase